MDEGLAIAFYTNRLPGYLTIASVRGRRGRNSYPLDSAKKIHTLTPFISVAEVSKSTFHTTSGQRKTSAVFERVAESLKDQKVTVREAAGRIQAALQSELVDRIDLKTELKIHQEDLLLALEPRYGLRPTRSFIDLRTGSVYAEGIVLNTRQPFQTAVTLPPINVMVAGFNVSDGRVVPDVYDVKSPGDVTSIRKIILDDIPTICIAPSIGGEISPSKASMNLVKLIAEHSGPLTIDQAVNLIADSISKTTKENLKLPSQQHIPLDLKVIKVLSDL